MTLTLVLFNGSKTRDAWNPESPEFIDDWKPESRELPIKFYQETYGTAARFVREDGTDFHLTWEDGLIEFDGVFYGDFMIQQGGGTAGQ